LLFSIFAGVVCPRRLSAKATTRAAERSHFGVLAALEERRDANETDVVIPHDGILALIARYLEGVLEHYIVQPH
jgi:hypothetical protein